MAETFSAKQVATRIGTDAKTLRKFLRSGASPYEAVGQGGRYEFPVADLADIKKTFMKWQGKKKPPTPAPVKTTPTTPKKSDMEIIDEMIEDDQEPSEDDLAAIEAGELDD